jgi:hypothetical protein
MAVAREWICKHVSTATKPSDRSNRYTHNNRELLEAVYMLLWSMPTLYKKNITDTGY